jgi:hypothetical protein
VLKLAEQFKKSYISVTEFIDSWEKEIYELTYLDYFSYLLINELASSIENDFFKKRNQHTQISISADEISTLSFNTADCLQGFFEKNCFDTCKLGCPFKLDDTLDNKNSIIPFNDYNTLGKSDQTKEQCLSSDILNYVILDSLLDFYNYELGIILTENDNDLLDLAEFNLNVIIQFIRLKGQRYLKTPQENASAYFYDLIQSDENSWKIDDIDLNNSEEDEQEQEPWKVDYSSIENVFEEFESEYSINENKQQGMRLLKKFQDYLSDFLELKRIDDLTMDDIEEFYSVVLPHEMLSEDEPCFDCVKEIFSKFLTYLEFTRNLYIQIPFEKFINKQIPEIIRTFKITNNYLKKYPFMDFLMSSDNSDITLVEGFYEIHKNAHDQFVVKDIHLNTQLEPVNISRLKGSLIRTTDIFHCHFVNKSGIWQIAHLEQVYPAVSKYYLY